MKKLLYPMGFFAIMACSDDDEQPQTCDNKLWNLSELCNPGSTENCTYLATYGESEATAGTVEVDQSTYNYYTALGNTDDGSLCWEGTQ